MKTSTLSKADLNRAVAMSLGHRVLNSGGVCDGVYIVEAGTTYFLLPNYAGDIAAAWPIIVEHKIWMEESNYPENWAVFAYLGPQGMGPRPKNTYSYGADHIEAALRAFVASVHGDEIDLGGAK